MRMRKITTLEELLEFLSAPIDTIKEAMQTIIDSFEEMKKLNAELSEIPEEKETYFYSFHPSIFIVRIMKFKRLWKRQKIP